jgi:O-antigen/teichoic acid export membrane protein
MLKNILSVGGYTLISRITGFVRDIVLAAVLGAGAIMDAFSVALRLPNHFRAIFGEGAVNQAYVPTYAQIAEKEGPEAASLFADRLFTVQLIVQVVLLALALPLMPWLVRLLAPGFSEDPAVFDLAVSLTRITFPYLLFVTMVTFLGATLNAVERYAAFAAAPILLNVFIVAALAVPFLFPSAAHAAAWGVAISGVAQWILLYVAAKRAGVSSKIVRPRADAGVRRFLKVFGPAVIGSAGVQIAIFADTIIASLLPRGGYAALYYAERLYQLPLGLIAIAVGTVALSAMSRAIARGDEAAANRAQNRAIAISLVASAPFVAAFVAVPELMVAGLFQRGAFDAQARAGLGLPGARRHHHADAGCACGHRLQSPAEAPALARLGRAGTGAGDGCRCLGQPADIVRAGAPPPVDRAGPAPARLRGHRLRRSGGLRDSGLVGQAAGAEAHRRAAFRAAVDDGAAGVGRRGDRLRRACRRTAEGDRAAQVAAVEGFSDRALVIPGRSDD